MTDGIVMYEDEQVGTWTTLDRTGVVIDFNDDSQRKLFLNLTEENGTELSFLQLPDENPS